MSNSDTPVTGSMLSTTVLFGLGLFAGLKQCVKCFMNCLLCAFRSAWVGMSKVQGNSLIQAHSVPIIIFVVRGWVQRPVIAPCLLYFGLLTTGNAWQAIEHGGSELTKRAIVNFDIVRVPFVWIQRLDGIHAIKSVSNDGYNPDPGASGIQPSSKPESQQGGAGSNNERAKVLNDRQPKGIHYWLWIAHGLGSQGLFVFGILLLAAFAVLDMKFFVIEAIVDWWKELRFKPNSVISAHAYRYCVIFSRFFCPEGGLKAWFCQGFGRVDSLLPIIFDF